METKAFPLGLGASLKKVSSIDHQGYVLFIEIQHCFYSNGCAITHHDMAANGYLFSVSNPRALERISPK